MSVCLGIRSTQRANSRATSRANSTASIRANSRASISYSWYAQLYCSLSFNTPPWHYLKTQLGRQQLLHQHYITVCKSLIKLHQPAFRQIKVSSEITPLLCPTHGNRRSAHKRIPAENEKLSASQISKHYAKGSLKITFSQYITNKVYIAMYLL